MSAAPWSAMSSDEKLEALLVDLAAMAKSMRRWAETLDRLDMPGSASVRCYAEHLETYQPLAVGS